MKFRDWIRQLDEEVIQGEYGYEDGEFTVSPDDWRPLWREGLSPSQAFRRALDSFADARREEDRLKQENWKRIQQAEGANRVVS
jgi:hypothetical protein